MPQIYQHLVEIKFVLGYPNEEESKTREYQEEEREIGREALEHEDLLRLEGLEGGENMDHGKTLEWVRWVGREGGERAAWWVIKCDDDVSKRTLEHARSAA